MLATSNAITALERPSHNSPTELTDADEARLLCIRAGSMCTDHGYRRFVSPEDMLGMRQCAMDNTAPIGIIVERAFPGPFAWLRDQGLPLTHANMRTHWREHHEDDATPHRQCEVLCRLRPEGKAWRVRTLSERIILVVLNDCDLLIPKDGAGNYLNVDVHCTTAGNMVSGGIIFDVYD